MSTRLITLTAIQQNIMKYMMKINQHPPHMMMDKEFLYIGKYLLSAFLVNDHYVRTVHITDVLTINKSSFLQT